MELILSSLSMLAQWDVLAALVIGSIGGVIIGAIPGVGAAVAIAILLPATFSFEPIVGLTLLLGVYGSSMYGGAIPAVLINTPGTAVNALTTYDGYPMTKKGQGHRALSLAYSASFFGGMFSILCLIVLSPVLAMIAPHFGSREIFLAALMGIILVVVAHRGQVFAAGMLACFGIFLSTIGLEPAKYTKRFTFDQSWLTSGVDLIVVVLGLFAISQALLLLVDKEHQPGSAKVEGNLFAGLKELFAFKRVATVSSGFGVLMGMIPGVGEFTAQFLSYTYAQKSSKDPDLFGKGSPEGLIASEAANNAVPGAAMIPLLALGIPGEALTAMMLSVFYVHNVIPGPQLFQGQLDFVVALYLALILLNIIVLIFLLSSTGLLLKIIQIPTRFLGVMIMTLSFVGVFSLRNSVTDCAIAAGFGVFGLVLKRLNLPIVPIILGMVLGGIMEVKLRSAMARVNSPLDFIDRPIAAIPLHSDHSHSRPARTYGHSRAKGATGSRRGHFRNLNTARVGTKMLDQAAIDVLRNQPVAEQGHFVNGAFAASREGATLEVLSPIDGKPLTRIASGTAADVGGAVEGARKAFEDGRWSKTAPAHRKKVLLKLADLIETKALELAVLGVRDNGTEINMAFKAEALSAAGTFRYYAEALDKIYGEIAPTADNVLGLVHRAPVGCRGGHRSLELPADDRRLEDCTRARHGELHRAETGGNSLAQPAQDCRTGVGGRSSGRCLQRRDRPRRRCRRSPGPIHGCRHPGLHRFRCDRAAAS